MANTTLENRPKGTIATQTEQLIAMLCLCRSHAPPRPLYQLHSRTHQRSLHSGTLPLWFLSTAEGAGRRSRMILSGCSSGCGRAGMGVCRQPPGESGTCQLQFPKPASRSPTSKYPTNTGQIGPSRARMAGMAGMAAGLRATYVPSLRPSPLFAQPPRMN
jgi:hypothetical protein